MKCFAILLGIVFSLNLSAAKIALIPTAPELAPLADQVLAAMSGEADAEFLERTEIDAILKEKKLAAAGLTGANLGDYSKILHADLFAVITAKPAKNGAAASGLIVYSARSGFRLININLPEQETVKEIVVQLKKAIQTHLHPERKTWLSVVAVRDAGIPERFKYKTAYLAVELERRLGGIPDVIVLERDYLDSLNQERELTGKMFKLTPSARLIRLEFSPGSEAEIADLKLRVTNTADNELFRWGKANCFADEKATLMQCINALSGYLKTAMPVEKSTYEYEDLRFIEEYKNLKYRGKYDLAMQKLDAAIALAPREIDYRIEKLKLNCLSGNTSIADRLEAWENNIKYVKIFKKDFPVESKKYYLFSDREIFNLSPPRLKGHQDCSELTVCVSKVRAGYEEEIIRQYKIVLGEPFKTINDRYRYENYLKAISQYELYYDFEKWCGLISKRAKEDLKLHMKLLKDIPELMNDEYLNDVFFCSFWIRELIGTYKNLRDYGITNGQLVMEKTLLDSSEYIAMASRHPWNDVKIHALVLNLLRKTVIAKYDEAVFRKDFDEYYRRVNEIGTKNVDRYNNIIKDFLDHLGAAPKLRKFMEQIALKPGPETKRNKPQLSELQKLYHAISIELNGPNAASQLIIRLPELLEHKKFAFTDVYGKGLYCNVGGHLLTATSNAKNSDLLSAKKYDKVITELSRDVEITKCHLDQKQLGLNPKSWSSIVNAVGYGDNLYLLLCGPGNTYAVAQADMDCKSIQVISSWSTQGNEYSCIGLTPPFAVSEQTAVAAVSGNIFIFPLNGGPIRYLSDFPCDTVMALAIMDRRVYAFLCRKDKDPVKYAMDTVLLSVKLDGTDRKIHISTLRDNPQNEFDRLYPFVVKCILADDAKKRIIFDCKSDRDHYGMNGYKKAPWGIWSFYPETGTGQCLFAEFNTSVHCNIRDGRLYSQNDSYEEVMFDPASDEAKVVFSLYNKNALYRWDGCRGLYNWCTSVFIRQGQMWLVDEGWVKLLTLPNVDKSPLFFVRANMVFPHPDGRSAVAVSDHDIYKVTPKEGMK